MASVTFLKRNSRRKQAIAAASLPAPMPASDQTIRAHRACLGYLQQEGLVVSLAALVDAQVSLRWHRLPMRERFLPCVKEATPDGEDLVSGITDFPAFARAVSSGGRTIASTASRRPALYRIRPPKLAKNPLGHEPPIATPQGEIPPGPQRDFS